MGSQSSHLWCLNHNCKNEFINVQLLVQLAKSYSCCWCEKDDDGMATTQAKTKYLYVVHFCCLWLTYMYTENCLVLAVIVMQDYLLCIYNSSITCTYKFIRNSVWCSYPKCNNLRSNILKPLGSFIQFHLRPPDNSQMLHNHC